MAKDVFDQVPKGYMRGKNKGWLHPAPSPQSQGVQALQKENEDLKNRLQQLEEVVAKLVVK